MDKKTLFEAVNMIDDDLIKEAEIPSGKLSQSDNAEDEMTVSGVEVYRRPKWSRFAAVAAVMALAVGLGAAGNMMMKHRSAMLRDDPDNITEESTEDSPVMILTKESEYKQGSGEGATAASHIEGPKPVENSASTSTAPDNGEEPTAVPIVEDNGRQQGTVQTSVQQNPQPAENTAEKTTAKTTTKATTKATTTKRTEAATTTKAPEPNEKMDVFARLNELTYSPETCDGLAEYVLNAPGDTEIFYFNFSGNYKWVWRNGSASNPVLKEAVLPDDLAEYLMEHGEEIGMYPAYYSIPVPMQGYSFNAQYIRTNGYSDGAVYPKKKLITSRAELDSYIEANKDIYDFKGWDTITGFMNATAKYDDNWFSSHKLLVVVLEEGSGSVSHTVAEVNGLGVTIQREIPEVGTCDMAEWHILIEVDKDLYVHSDFRVSTYEKHIR